MGADATLGLSPSPSHRGQRIISTTGCRGEAEHSHIIYIDLRIDGRRDEQQGRIGDVCLFARVPGDGSLEASLGCSTMSIPSANAGLEKRKPSGLTK